MAPARTVHDLVAGGEPGDRFRNEALLEDAPGGLDPVLPRTAGGFGFLDQPRPGAGQRRIAEQLARFRQPPVGQVNRRRGRPFLAEERLHRGDGGDRMADKRIAAAGELDGRAQQPRQVHRAVVAGDQQPGVDGAGHAGRQQAGARHDVEAQGMEGVDGGRRGRRALSADDPQPFLVRAPDERRHVAAGSVQVRLDHLQRETGRDRRVEGVAALFQHGHGGGRRQPVRRGGDAESAEQFGARSEHGAPLYPVTRLL